MSIFCFIPDKPLFLRSDDPIVQNPFGISRFANFETFLLNKNIWIRAIQLSNLKLDTMLSISSIISDVTTYAHHIFLAFYIVPHDPFVSGWAHSLTCFNLWPIYCRTWWCWRPSPPWCTGHCMRSSTEICMTRNKYIWQDQFLCKQLHVCKSKGCLYCFKTFLVVVVNRKIKQSFPKYLYIALLYIGIYLLTIDKPLMWGWPSTCRTPTGTESSPWRNLLKNVWRRDCRNQL